VPVVLSGMWLFVAAAGPIKFKSHFQAETHDTANLASRTLKILAHNLST